MHDTRTLRNALTYLSEDKINGWEQVKTEVNELPMDTLSLVFLLFKNEHVMIEELLKLFVGDVDAKLFKRVQHENFKAGNIQYTNEESTSIIGLKGLVGLFDDPQEHTFVQSLGQSTNRVGNLIKNAIK